MTDLNSGTRTTTPATSGEATSFADFGKEMWSYLTGKGAAINYEMIDMEIEVPRDTGPDSPRAVWKLNGTLRITTTDDDVRGAAG